MKDILLVVLICFLASCQENQSTEVEKNTKTEMSNDPVLTFDTNKKTGEYTKVAIGKTVFIQSGGKFTLKTTKGSTADEPTLMDSSPSSWVFEGALPKGNIYILKYAVTIEHKGSQLDNFCFLSWYQNRTEEPFFMNLKLSTDIETQKLDDRHILLKKDKKILYLRLSGIAPNYTEVNNTLTFYEEAVNPIRHKKKAWSGLAGIKGPHLMRIEISTIPFKMEKS
jgi:hypothetical protein